MSINEEVLKELRKETQEASWCKTCLRRNTCNIKEAVAFEEHMIEFSARKYVNVTAKCSQYIKDTKAKPEQCIWDRFK